MPRVWPFLLLNLVLLGLLPQILAQQSNFPTCDGNAPIPEVLVFFDNEFVDTSDDALSNLNVVKSFTPVTTFTSFQPDNLRAEISGYRVFLIPELERRDWGIALSANDRKALRDFVNDGSILIIHGEFTNRFSSFFLTVFEIDVVRTVPSFAEVLLGAPISTEGSNGDFAQGPPSLPRERIVTPIDMNSLPPTAKSIYDNGTQTWVTVFPYGQGNIVYNGYSYFDGSQPDWDLVEQLSVMMGCPGTAPSLPTFGPTPRSPTASTTAPLRCPNGRASPLATMLTDSAFTDRESDTANTLAAVQQYARVALIETFQQGALTSLLSGFEVFVVPELENGDFKIALNSEDRQGLRKFVRDGNVLILHGDFNNRDRDLLGIFNINVERAIDVAAVNELALRTRAAGVTLFRNGPELVPNQNTIAPFDSSSYPASATVLYGYQTQAWVTLFAYGKGVIIHNGYSYFAGSEPRWNEVVRVSVQYPCSGNTLSPTATMAPTQTTNPTTQITDSPTSVPQTAQPSFDTSGPTTCPTTISPVQVTNSPTATPTVSPILQVTESPTRLTASPTASPQTLAPVAPTGVPTAASVNPSSAAPMVTTASPSSSSSSFSFAPTSTAFPQSSAPSTSPFSSAPTTTRCPVTDGPIVSTFPPSIAPVGGITSAPTAALSPTTVPSTNSAEAPSSIPTGSTVAPTTSTAPTTSSSSSPQLTTAPSRSFVSTANPTSASPQTTSPTLTMTPTPQPFVTANRAVFNDQNVTIEVGFSQPTNMPELSCSGLFDANTIVLLGEEPLCAWIAPDLVEIKLGPQFSVNISDVITVLGDVVTFPSADPRSGTTFTPQTTLLLEAPVDLKLPSVEILGPREVGPCILITLQAMAHSGTAGRELTLYQWTYVEGSADSVAVNADLQLDTTTADFSSDLLPPGLHAVQVLLVNWLGAQSVIPYEILKLIGPVPDVRLPTGLTIFQRRSDPLDVRTLIAEPECTESSDLGLVGYTVTTRWFQVFPGTRLAENLGNVGLLLTNDSVQVPNPTDSDLRIPPDTLQFGLVYGFNILVEQEDAQGIVGLNTSVVVNVLIDPVIAVIEGGSSITVPVLQEQPMSFRIDGSSSFDPAAGPEDALQYEWRMESSFGDAVALPPASANQSTLVINTDDQGLSSDLTYIVQLIVTGVAVAGRLRGANATQVVFTSPTLIPTVRIGCNVPVGGTFNTNEMLRCATAVTPGESDEITYRWSNPSGALNLETNTAVLTPITAPSLVIAENALPIDRSITFAVTIQDGVDAGSITEIQFFTNAPPGGGSCFSDGVTSGIALETIFSLSCTGWIDVNLPLRYSFYVEQGAGKGTRSTDGKAAVVPICELSNSPTCETQLPSNRDGSPVLIEARIVDILGARSSFDFSVSVAPRALDLNATFMTLERLPRSSPGAYSVYFVGLASWLRIGDAAVNDTLRVLNVARLQRSLWNYTQNAMPDTEDFAVLQPLGLLEAATSFLFTEELSLETRGIGLQVALNSTTSRLNTFAAEIARAYLRSIGNIAESANSDTSATFEQSVREAAFIEELISKFGSRILDGSVIGEPPLRFNTPVINVAFQRLLPKQVPGATIRASNGASVGISRSANISAVSGPVDVILGYVDASTLYPVPVGNWTGSTIVQLIQGGGTLNINGLSVPSNVSLPILQPLGMFTAPSCNFWVEEQRLWSVEGLQSRVPGDDFENSLFVTCETSHFTTFTVELVAVSPPGDVEDVDSEASAASTFLLIISRPTMLFCFVMLVAYVVFSLLAHWHDERRMGRMYSKWVPRFWRKSNNVLLSLREGERGSELCMEMTGWGLRRSHSWISVCSRHHGDYLNSFKRITILFVLIFAAATICCALLVMSTVEDAASVAVLTAALCLPIPYLFSLMFVRVVPEQYAISLEDGGGISCCIQIILLVTTMAPGHVLQPSEEEEEEEEEEEDREEDDDIGNYYNSDDNLSSKYPHKQEQQQQYENEKRESSWNTGGDPGHDGAATGRGEVGGGGGESAGQPQDDTKHLSLGPPLSQQDDIGRRRGSIDSNKDRLAPPAVRNKREEAPARHRESLDSRASGAPSSRRDSLVARRGSVETRRLSVETKGGGGRSRTRRGSLFGSYSSRFPQQQAHREDNNNPSQQRRQQPEENSATTTLDNMFGPNRFAADRDEERGGTKSGSRSHAQGRGRRVSIKSVNCVRKLEEDEKSYNENDHDHLRSVLDLENATGIETLNTDKKSFQVRFNDDKMTEIESRVEKIRRKQKKERRRRRKKRKRGRKDDASSHTMDLDPLYKIDLLRAELEGRPYDGKGGGDEEDSIEPSRRRCTIRDTVAVVVCWAVCVALWVLLVALASTEEGRNDVIGDVGSFGSFRWVGIVVLALVFDIMIRAAMLTLATALVYAPCGGKRPHIFGWADEESEERTGVREIKREVGFRPGTIGIEYLDKIVTRVMPRSQADGKVREGWRIVSIDGNSINTDDDINRLIQFSHRVAPIIRIEFRLDPTFEEVEQQRGVGAEIDSPDSRLRRDLEEFGISRGGGQLGGIKGRSKYGSSRSRGSGRISKIFSESETTATTASDAPDKNNYGNLDKPGSHSCPGDLVFADNDLPPKGRMMPISPSLRHSGTGFPPPALQDLKISAMTFPDATIAVSPPGNEQQTKLPPPLVAARGHSGRDDGERAAEVVSPPTRMDTQFTLHPRVEPHDVGHQRKQQQQQQRPDSMMRLVAPMQHVRASFAPHGSPQSPSRGGSHMAQPAISKTSAAVVPTKGGEQKQQQEEEEQQQQQQQRGNSWATSGEESGDDQFRGGEDIKHRRKTNSDDNPKFHISAMSLSALHRVGKGGEGDPKEALSSGSKSRVSVASSRVSGKTHRTISVSKMKLSTKRI